MQKNTKKLGALLSTLAISSLLFSGANLAGAQNTGAPPPASGPDTTPPSDVKNLRAIPGDNEILLEWDAATDDIGVTSYKIYAGTHAVKEGDSYDLPPITTGTITKYTVPNLINDQTYYFSAAAFDAAGNGSENYATEVNATPSAAADDGKAPQVKEVKSEDIITVLAVFSEAVKLPEEHPASAFTVETLADKSKLEVQKAEIDTRDESGATVLLTTAPQTENTEYLLTAGLEIQDLLGTPVKSGTADTGSFKGSAKKRPAAPAEPPVEPAPAPPPPPPAPLADTEAPKLTGGSADFNNRLVLNFSEKVKLPENPKSQFTVTKKGTATALKIINVSLSVDGQSIYLTTDPQQAVEYEVKVSGVTDQAGNDLAAETRTAVVSGKGASLEDLVPPEDVTKLVARIKDAEKNLVELRWEASLNTAGDLADQMLYQSTGSTGKNFGKGASLGKDTLAVEVEDLKPGSWYTFKVTAQDTNGNESKGALKAVFLPQTGPGMVAAGVTALLMTAYRRRKKR